VLCAQVAPSGECLRGKSPLDRMLAKPWRRLFLAAVWLNLVVVAVLLDDVALDIVAVLRDRLLWGWALCLNHNKEDYYYYYYYYYYYSFGAVSFLFVSLCISDAVLHYRTVFEGRLSELFCVVLCTKAVHSHKYTQMSSSYSSLDWVLSHWACFTVR